MNKTLIAILIIIIVGAGAYFLLTSTSIQAPSNETSQMGDGYELGAPGDSATSTTVQTTTTTTVSPHVISFSSTGYSPNSLTVKVGDTVTFKNDSSISMWPASASHPTHGVYPTTGGCLGSTFDACKGVQPGEAWSFKFDNTGNWKYHDHLKPTFFGTIIVEA
jgi:plastocyanin